MIRLMIEEYLNTHSDWEEKLSQSPYNLTIRRDNGLVLFKYSQYESDMSLRICQEARGIIFDEKTLKPVCIPYFKFFNHGEENAAKIDWDTAIVQEKIDGSLIKMFYYGGEWHVATNGTIDAFKATVNDKDANFGALFIDALGGLSCYVDLCSVLNKKYCYMFELVHPLTQVVIAYDKPAVYFHGLRNMETYEELVPGPLVHCLSPHNFGFNSLSQTLSLIAALNNGEHEGVVVCDGNFNRVKMKTAEYLAKAKVANRGPLTPKMFWRLYQADQLDDYMGFAPEQTGKVKEYCQKLLDFEEKLELAAMWADEAGAVDRKDYVMKVRNGLPSVAFAYCMFHYDKKGKAVDFVSQMSYNKLCQCVEL